VLTNAGLPATIDTAVTPLKAFCRRANIRGDATLNPFVGMAIPALLRDHLDAVDGPLASRTGSLGRTTAAKIWRAADLPMITLHEARHA
jgi:hypothetical protein